MKSSRAIYVMMLIVFLLIVFGLIYRLTKDKNTNDSAPESHTGYPY